MVAALSEAVHLEEPLFFCFTSSSSTVNNNHSSMVGPAVGNHNRLSGTCQGGQMAEPSLAVVVLLHKSVYNCTFDILILRDQVTCFGSSLESHRVLTHKSISLKLIIFCPFLTGAWEGGLGTTHSYLTEGEFILNGNVDNVNSYSWN